MANKIAALLIDLDGVLYQEGRPIQGARKAVDWLRARKIPHLFVTNTTSRPRRALAEQLAGMGIEVTTEEILTPAIAAVAWLQAHTQGPVGLFVQEATKEDFADLTIAAPGATAPVSAVVVGDYGESWSFATLNRAFRWLMADPQPLLIALGMTRYWQASDGLRLDTGPFVAALEFATGVKATIVGKPARGFFEAALDRLNATPRTACMIGDDVVSDIGGAQALGIHGMLVKTGKFRPADLSHSPLPMVILPSIAELPTWWDTHH
ncbi:TIGR01458 family HAD-type hydrolase [Thiorhodococcus minor]|uniref:Haloacid dehalogenase-like hydrolase domain-containing protein 2 n=1 Tax=Thiorhodococcus minor TaxID=57489 RepID=A0A6M0JZZ7_9GAMM|nr:TIGR01458 family HAD-type hydrolase [Thiorhodococcus minor]NEV61645.1 TIGR01458 family HAD-type hydrolase [Thiorhodococcus minor]